MISNDHIIISKCLKKRIHSLEDMLSSYKGSWHEEQEERYINIEEQDPLAIALGCSILFEIATDLNLHTIANLAELLRLKAIEKNNEENEMWDECFDQREKENNEYLEHKRRAQCQALTVANTRCGHKGTEIKTLTGSKVLLCKIHKDVIYNPKIRIPTWE
ncbi:hypothetical protein MNBD_GAMMA11-3438 [hydrothermal vent metagenome]|uniref:Uncharacterized protein n=1 Tax=hydrothermal vent metagenome TaxID=652676 RepID=A0A3B0XC37_9ZZZZ